MTGSDRKQRTIIALATPLGRSALAIIRISGPQSIAITTQLTEIGECLQNSPTHTIHYTAIIDPERSTSVDLVVVLLYRAPHSYSGENTVEICCHGNPAIIEQIINLYQRYGAEPAEPGEFTLQAMLNNRLDLTQAEAVEALIVSKGQKAREIALSHLHGSLRDEIEMIKKCLVRVAAGINIQLDYPIEESGELTVDDTAILKSRDQLRRLISSYRVGKLSHSGITVVLIGKPNSGKSSLFNRLLREERAIVSHQAGTTRDYLESQMEIDGFPLRILDTAGLRDSTHDIEQEGVHRTRMLMETAELILYVIDINAGLDDEEQQEIQQMVKSTQQEEKRIILVYNKIDLVAHNLDNPQSLQMSHANQSDIQTTIPTVFVSAQSGAGISDLTTLLVDTVSSLRKSSDVGRDDVVVCSKRQLLLLQRAEVALRHAEEQHAQKVPLDMLVLDIEEAIHALGQITGAVATADMLREMFSNFCVGK